MSDHLVSGECLVELKGLKKHFPIRRGLLGREVGATRAVDGVDLNLFCGETLGLVGESGCGKTTLGRLIIRLYEPSAGTILFDGQDISKMGTTDLRKFRRRMQMMFQDPYSSMNPRMCLHEIVTEPICVNERHDRTWLFEKAGHLLEMVGLSADCANRFPHELSGGQRQRVAVARGLALNPQLLICDEPVSALDVSIRAQILNLLKRLQDELGLTYLFISHDLSAVLHISDRVAVMYLGKVVELVPSDNIYLNPMHPYSLALLAAIPIPDPVVEREREQHELEGDIPSPANPPKGCRFHTRCPMFKRGLCDDSEPVLTERSPGHWVACHLV